jgi:hypothetical protein
VAQASQIGQDESWGWPCPYCRAHNPMDAAECANCGSQLRDPDEDDLFTTVAADNAEVIPPDAPFGRDNMWTTAASEADDVDQGEFVDDDLWEPAPGVPGATGNAFTAEPPSRSSDVIDEPFDVDDGGRVGRPRTSGTLFSNGSANGRGADPRVDPPRADETGRSPFAAPGVGADPWAGQDHRPPAGNGWGPQPAPGSAPGPFAAPVPPTAHAAPSGYETAPPAGSWQYTPAPGPFAEPPHAPVPDPHGLSAAVGRLRAEDQERAATPIAVCGALLQHDEVVLAAVTGQMLGHPAVVVLSTRRVLVVNGRRWQPIVDVFDVGPSLTVRGRHDRDVAALTFSDETRLSTVDGISEVGLAVELAERIRGE